MYDLFRMIFIIIYLFIYNLVEIISPIRGFKVLYGKRITITMYLQSDENGLWLHEVILCSSLGTPLPPERKKSQFGWAASLTWPS